MRYVEENNDIKFVSNNIAEVRPDIQVNEAKTIRVRDDIKGSETRHSHLVEYEKKNTGNSSKQEENYAAATTSFDQADNSNFNKEHSKPSKTHKNENYVKRINTAENLKPQSYEYDEIEYFPQEKAKEKYPEKEEVIHSKRIITDNSENKGHSKKKKHRIASRTIAATTVAGKVIRGSGKAIIYTGKTATKTVEKVKDNADTDKQYYAHDTTEKGFRSATYSVKEVAKDSSYKAQEFARRKLYKKKPKAQKTIAYTQGKLNAITHMVKNIKKPTRTMISKGIKNVAKKIGKSILKAVLVVFAPIIPILLILIAATSIVGGVVDLFSGAGSSKFAKAVNYRIEEYEERYDEAIKELAKEYPNCDVYLVGRKATIKDMIYVWFWLSDDEIIISSTLSGKAEVLDTVNSRNLTQILEYMCPVPTKSDCSYDEENEILTIELASRSYDEAIKNFNIKMKNDKMLRIANIMKDYDKDENKRLIMDVKPMTVIDVAIKNTSINTKFLFDWYGSKPTEWNNIFTCYCLDKSVRMTDVPKTNSSEDIKKFYNDRGLFFDKADHTPSPCDIMVLNNGKTAIVTDVKDGMVMVVQGNTNNTTSAESVIYELKDSKIDGYCTPLYQYDYK